MNQFKQVKGQYDYWFENKPNQALEKEKAGKHHTYSVKPEFLQDIIENLRNLAKSRALTIAQEYFGNKATKYEEAFQIDWGDKIGVQNEYTSTGEILAGDRKKHHNQFFAEVVKDKKDFNDLIVTVLLYQPSKPGADFVISLPFELNVLYPTISYRLERALALTGLSDIEKLRLKNEPDMSEMRPYHYTPHNSGLEVKLIDENDIERIVSKAVAQSYEVLFEHYKGREVSGQIDRKAALLRRMRDLMIDFEKIDAIPEEKPAVPEEVPFKSELADIIETERKRTVVYLFEQKEIKRLELPVFATESDSALIEIAKKDEDILKVVGKGHYVGDAQIVLRSDSVVVCTLESYKEIELPKPPEPAPEDPVFKDIKTEFSKFPAGRRLEAEKRRQAYESFRTKWSDDPETIESAFIDLNKALRMIRDTKRQKDSNEVKEAFEEIGIIHRRQDTSGDQETPP